MRNARNNSIIIGCDVPYITQPFTSSLSAFSIVMPSDTKYHTVCCLLLTIFNINHRNRHPKSNHQMELLFSPMQVDLLEFSNQSPAICLLLYDFWDKDINGNATYVDLRTTSILVCFYCAETMYQMSYYWCKKNLAHFRKYQINKGFLLYRSFWDTLYMTIQIKRCTNLKGTR